jgi:hypothetical protein
MASKPSIGMSLPSFEERLHRLLGLAGIELCDQKPQLLVARSCTEAAGVFRRRLMSLSTRRGLAASATARRRMSCSRVFLVNGSDRI